MWPDRLLEQMDQRELMALAADMAELALWSLPPYQRENPRLNRIVRALRTIALGGDVKRNELMSDILDEWVCSSGKNEMVCDILERARRVMDTAEYDLAGTRLYLRSALQLLRELAPEAAVNLIVFRMAPADQIGAAIEVGDAALTIMWGNEKVSRGIMDNLAAMWSVLRAGAAADLGDIRIRVVEAALGLLGKSGDSRVNALVRLTSEIGEAILEMPCKTFRHVREALKLADVVRPGLACNVLLGAALSAEREEAIA